MIYILLFTWCLPQTLLAYIIRAFVKPESIQKEGIVVVYRVNWKTGSLSLSNKVFLCKSHWENKRVLMHEIGHYKQSLILGWLFLLVIGLPSIMWAWWGHDAYNNLREKKGKSKVSYYEFYTEKWADKLGGVKNI